MAVIGYPRGQPAVLRDGKHPAQGVILITHGPGTGGKQLRRLLQVARCIIAADRSVTQGVLHRRQSSHPVILIDSAHPAVCVGDA